ncbi:Cytochrome p450 [Thalictrum thalictroides]|uniref:Cytochrome p450 n=1 Tax=Thalictrum thalictroides TaxID=46969 RepID=A0A7J6WP48_THATH|nr:Cytochrome p450 [Thalictrum thalictroides]
MKIKTSSSSSSSESHDSCKIPKGSSGWPFIGETLHYIASGCSSHPVSFMEKRKSLYGNVFKSHLLGIPIIVSTDPDVNKVVLQNNGSTFIPYYPKSITELLGKSSILQMNGNLQKKVHGLIGGFLKSSQLKARITKEIEKSVFLSMDSWKDKELVYMQEETKNITFPVLVKVLMGVDQAEDLEFLKKEFGEFIKGLVCLPIKLPGTRLYKSLKAKEKLLKMVKRIVEEKRLNLERIRTQESDQMDAVEVLLGDTAESLPLDFISGNVIEMMIPGEESVPMLMTLAIKYLSDCPLALKQLLEENMVLKRQKNQLNEEDYVWTDYMSLPFTQNVISETLRMANIVNAVWRKALKDVEIKGYLVPKGWCMLVSFLSIHMDEENYENPYQFNPWRWQSKQGHAAVNYNSFTPFGGGQRLCPGVDFSRLEVSIFLHHFITSYRWEAEEDFIVNFPTVKMKRKLPIRVTPISPSQLNKNHNTHHNERIQSL